jgi:hypothetical protein
MREAAINGKYGIVFAQIGETVIAEMCNSFVGLIDINLRGNLDSLFNIPELSNPGCRPSLMKMAYKMVGQGVQFRKKGDFLNAFLCYRFALPLVSESRDAEGCQIISGNLFIVQNNLRPEKSNEASRWINETKKKDASALLNKYETALSSSYLDQSAEADKFFLFYLRLLQFSGRNNDSRDILNKKIGIHSIPNKYLMDGVLETLTRTEAAEILIPSEGAGFKQVLDTYLKIRTSLPSIENAIRTQELYEAVIKHFEAIRGMLKSTGLLALRFHYTVSEYLNILGRDLTCLKLRSGNIIGALETIERTKSGHLPN